VPAAERPPIRRTNVVTAEPMPGDRLLVLEFSTGLEPRVLGELFQQMVNAMELAGELGSLLRIDRALERAVAEARRQFLAEEQLQLPGFAKPPRQLGFDLSDVSDASFFDSAEERIVAALAAYAAQAPASMTVRRRLFAEDASQGIAFIDLPAGLVWFDTAGRHQESLDADRSVGEQMLFQFHRKVTSLVRPESSLDDVLRAMRVVQAATTSQNEGRRVYLA
jgi:hypothetical protein